MNPRLAGALDALKGEDIPADRRKPIPFDGPDRLAYWRAKRETEQNPDRARESLGRTLAARFPGYTMRASTVGVSDHRAVGRTHDSPGALPRPSRGALKPARTRGAGETEAVPRSRLRTEARR